MRAILTFHSVDDSGSALSIAPEALQSLVRAIRRSGHQIVALSELLDSPSKPRQIALAFDDGIATVHEHALPILGAEGAPATLFLTTDHVGGQNTWPDLSHGQPVLPMMTWGQVDDLHQAGWAIESHTATHADLRRLPSREIECELSRCDDAIERRIGIRPSIFAYPFGHFDARVLNRVQGRYRFAVTARMGCLPPRLEAPHLVPRLETYYFRSPALHRGFGGPLFAVYVALRAWARRIRYERPVTLATSSAPGLQRWSLSSLTSFPPRATGRDRARSAPRV